MEIKRTVIEQLNYDLAREELNLAKARFELLQPYANPEPLISFYQNVIKECPIRIEEIKQEINKIKDI